MPEVMRCVVFYMLKAAEGGLCLLEVLDVLEEPEMIRCVLLCLMEVFDALDVPEVTRSVLLCMLEVTGGAGGDTLCASSRGGSKL